MAPIRNYTTIDPDSKNGDSPKSAKKGFTVGPDNLPDGTYRRKGKYLGRQLYPS